jgi:putative dehydrogenase
VIAVIGVGNMGGAMAANLLDRGWPVQVYDQDATKCLALSRLGALMCASAADAARAATTTIICVVDALQTVEVLFGAGGVADAMHLGHTVMLCPTMAPDEVENIALRLRPFGLHCVDAPMSGGPARARAGDMSLMLACAPNVLERQRALIDALSSRAFHVGERIGDGARTKLVNNLAAGINLIAAAEVLAMAARMGLDAARTLDVMEQSSGQSWIGSDRMRRAIAGDLTPRAHMTLLEKDTRLAVRAALDAGFVGPLGAAARDVFAQAAAAGLADHDDAALLVWLGDKSPIQTAHTPARPPV